MTDEPTRSDDTESVFHRFEEGDTIVTGGRTITESDVMSFAGVSGDFNHLHTDEERMSESTFGERIAHGMLVVSAATGLIWQHRTVEERHAVVAFYGLDRLRFLQPVFIGDTIHVEKEVIETKPRSEGPGNGTVRYAVEIKNQQDEAVIAFEMISLFE